jgi:uncharacterized membrane protein SpoIIM required for sporulation
MLPEIILREEETLNIPALIGLGFIAGVIGIWASMEFFSSNQSLLAPMIAALPLVFPLMNYYFRHERDENFEDETIVYGSLFFGVLISFFVAALYIPDFFAAQAQTTGLTGQAIAQGPTFVGVFTHNLTLYFSILLISALLGSAGVFILSLNASMVGVFFGNLFSSMPNSFAALTACSEEQIAAVGMQRPSFLCYLPHTFFEMGGFIIAGVLGTTLSATVYREHFGLNHWKKLALYFLIGLVSVFIGALLETWPPTSLISVIINAF